LFAGDNHGYFDDLIDSISGVISCGLAGITMVGADIGGIFFVEILHLLFL
jgi:alpha-glucosidase (family GH31 glycosyl hydrolase)